MNVEKMRNDLQVYCNERFTCNGCPAKVGIFSCEFWGVSDDEIRKKYRLVFPEKFIRFDFGEALKELKAGKRVSREGWNGKGLFVVYQKGYPQGIPCNKQTAEAWGMKEGELFRCEPYLQINTVDGSHAMWVPSIRDCLAEDWFVLEE